MKKRIIICCDGAWNSPKKFIHGGITNITKLVHSIKSIDTDHGIQQVVFHHPGYDIGRGRLNRYIPDATDETISHSIEDCYRFLANNYVEGDEIFCFSSGRGTVTARLLVELLDCAGLLSKEELDSLPKVLKYFQTQPERRQVLPISLANTIKPRIRLFAAWDTIATTAPIMGSITKKWWYSLFEAPLSKNVERAYQALAIDEHRKCFSPILWSASQEKQTVTQVWFAGTHSNIGGGYEDAGLSDLAFNWVVRRAECTGLFFNCQYLYNLEKVKPNLMGGIHDSFSVPHKLLQQGKRHLRSIGHGDTAGEMIHESVIERLERVKSYTPDNLLQGVANIDERIGRENNRFVIAVGNKKLPIFRERHTTRTAQIIEGRFTPSTDNNIAVSGKIHDYSISGGASLICPLNTPIRAGTHGVLSAPHLGTITATVAWCNNRGLGLKFAT